MTAKPSKRRRDRRESGANEPPREPENAHEPSGREASLTDEREVEGERVREESDRERP